MNQGAVVVTGAASGIGAVTAATLRASGRRVIGIDRAAGAICDRVIETDLCDPGAIEAALAAIREETVDALVNCAGLPGTADARSIYAVNVLAPRALSEALAPRFPVGGAIVHVSSGAGWFWRQELGALLPMLSLPDAPLLDALLARATDGKSAYELSKAMLTLHAMAMAAHVAKGGVRVNAIAPGGVATRMLPAFRDSMGAAVLDWAEAAVGRHATASEIAEVAVFLVSPGSRWVNGAEIVVDGGLVAGMLTGAWPPPN
jgi:NAD(P)-dependent dehydrogenase (short-subunit alcohol dehydrogenase family)